MNALWNRQFMPASSESVHCALLGRHPHPSGIIQDVDPASVEAMALRIRADNRAPNFPGLVVDCDHDSFDPNKSTRAAGWIKDAEARADGLWCKVDFTSFGESLVSDGTFRNVSPVFDRATMQDLGNNHFRPLKLLGVALCNDPNIKGMVPISNRRTAAHSAALTQRKPRPKMISNRTTPPKLQRMGAVITVTDCITQLKRVTGESFDQLWNSSAPFFNRFNNRDGAIAADSFWRQILAKEQEAFDATYNVLEKAGPDVRDRGNQLYTSVRQLPDHFFKALREEMMKGATYEQAWDNLKEREPHFFARHIWAMTAGDATYLM